MIVPNSCQYNLIKAFVNCLQLLFCIQPVDGGTYCKFAQKWISGALHCQEQNLTNSYTMQSFITITNQCYLNPAHLLHHITYCINEVHQPTNCIVTEQQTHLPPRICPGTKLQMQSCSSQGNHVISILHVLLKIPGGT